MTKQLNKIKATGSSTSTSIICIDRAFAADLVQELIMLHLRNLANDLGDCLAAIEVVNNSMSAKIAQHYECKLQGASELGTELNIDSLAEGLDNILKIQIPIIVNGCRNLINNQYG